VPSRDRTIQDVVEQWYVLELSTSVMNDEDVRSSAITVQKIFFASCVDVKKQH
jgi:hypothetical protein